MGIVAERLLVPPEVTKPTFEHHPTGLGIGHSQPRISWRFISSLSTIQGWCQTSYEVELTLLDAVGNSGQKVTSVVNGDASVLVPWPGHPLRSREAASVRVRSFGKGINQTQSLPTNWSPSASVEVGLLEKQDWTAFFITSTYQPNPDGPLQPLRFKKIFELSSRKDLLSKARLYITSLGVFNAYLDGVKVSDECMAPGWTSYRHRLPYRVYDVTSFVHSGRSPKSQDQHCLSVEVGEGWYAGRLGFRGGRRFQYGNEIGVLAQLEIEYSDESARWTLTSDETWTAFLGGIQTSEIYDGELYDMNKERSGRNSVESTAAGREDYATKIISAPAGAELICPDIPPVRVTEELTPVKVFQSKSGKTIIDFGQNLVGKLLIKRLQVPAGQAVKFLHAEVMEYDELGTRPLRFAAATDTIISSGDVLSNWSPRFTFHGFRYVQVEGWTPGIEDLVALVMHSDMTRRGYFSCSNEQLNQLHRNVVWSMRGNFLSVPTDCPQRDERLGWTGDLQVFCPTAAFLYDSVGMLSNWLEDVMAEQLEEGKEGIPPLVVPIIEPLGNWPHIPQAVWDDVTVLTPADLHRFSGDLAILEKQMDSMRAWLDKGVDRAMDGLWNPDRWQLGDWLDPAAPPDDPGLARTDGIFVANAYLIHTTATMARNCRLLGRDKLADKYAADASRLLELFQNRYITRENLVAGGSTQTALALTIMFKLYSHGDSAAQVAVAQELGKLVRLAKFRVATGFAGTPIICHALTASTQTQLAYRMVLETSCPSWLYPVTMGATTIWERWDSMRSDGTINPGQMTSFNHYALGSVADWLHTTVGGISPIVDEQCDSRKSKTAGWKVFRVRPVPGGNLTSAEVKFDGPYGMIECRWELSDVADSTSMGKRFDMTLVVPPNSSARLTLPDEIRRDAADTTPEPVRLVLSGRHEFSCLWMADAWPPKPLLAANQRYEQEFI